MNHLNLQNPTTQAKQISASRTDPSVVGLLNQLQALQRNPTANF